MMYPTVWLADALKLRGTDVAVVRLEIVNRAVVIVVEMFVKKPGWLVDTDFD
jgi:hypothetical protein